MSTINNFPALVSGFVAAALIAGLRALLGDVPEVQIEHINALVGWFVPPVLTILAAIFTHRRVSPVAAEDRGL